METEQKREKTQTEASTMYDAAIRLYHNERARLKGQAIKRSVDLNIHSGRKYYLGKAVNALDKEGVDPVKVLPDVLADCKKHLIQGENMERGAMAAHEELLSKIPA